MASLKKLLMDKILNSSRRRSSSSDEDADARLSTSDDSFAPAPSQLPAAPEGSEEVCFAAGCFTSLEAAFGCLDGVIMSATGYCGGWTPNPSHAEVTSRATGHTEAVKVIYDPKVVTFQSLCDAFWSAHDPTNRIYQGFGVDTHYRSAIFYQTEEQRKRANESKVRQQIKLGRRVATKILPATDFFYADATHQKSALQSLQPQLFHSLHLRSSKQIIESTVACRLNGYVTGMATAAAIKDLQLHSFSLSEETKDHLRTLQFLR